PVDHACAEPITRTLHTPTATHETSIPFTYTTLFRSDPTNSSSLISYTLSENASVTIKIYNGSNTLVRTLVNGVAKSSGANSSSWDLKDDSAVALADGTYTYKNDAADAAGNNPTQQTGTVTIDKTNPVISAVSDTPDPTNSSRLTPNSPPYPYTTLFRSYNGSNTLVRTLVNGVAKSSGANSSSWDLKDDSAVALADG